VGCVALLICGMGCVRRAGRNSDCRWPAENPLPGGTARHLSADVEFAEDLAIRYADTHHGLRTPNFVSGTAYDGARDGCMGALFDEIATTHGVSRATVSNALGRDREWIDLGMILPFALLYCFGAAVAARIVWRRYPAAEEGWIPGAVMIVFVSLALAAVGVMVGELWCWNVETLRVGNEHMSYRVHRLWWTRHQGALFAGGVVACWVAGWRRRGNRRS
jgi:hypothetical protein